MAIRLVGGSLGTVTPNAAMPTSCLISREHRCKVYGTKSANIVNSLHSLVEVRCWQMTVGGYALHARGG